MYKNPSTVSFFKVLKNAGRILRNPLPFHHENFQKYGDVFNVKIGLGKSVIFTRDGGFAKHMLQKQHKKYAKSDLQTKDLAKYIGEGLLTSNGEKWLRQRRLIQPAFHKKKLESLVDIIKEVIQEESDKITADKVIDVFPLMSDLAFNVVAKSLFSYTDTGNTISRLQYITETAQKSLIKEIRQPYKRWWFYLSGKIKNTNKLTQEARDILNTIIEERKKSDKEYHDLLDMLLAARYEDGSMMDNEQLIDEILILFVAGHETTSNALTFTLALLAMHPEIQDRVYTEVSDNKEVVFSSPIHEIAKYTYTKQCIEEAMRLYPPVYFSDRVAIEEDEYNNLKLKKGNTILISFFEIHRHKDFWSNPDQFNPDRFDIDVDKKEYSDHYFPFGAGPRMCIGNNFAMYEMILAISNIVKKHKISTSLKAIEIQPLITLKPKNAVLQFTTR
ncbi:cytochrome P450 [Aquimarina muelleri]|uniref:Cytochrome P450 n=1 Tax=Aquimarina muelleri TaxID=279356 RepID=A0A918JUY0_9FLAO|nr:cytochrome P450 [Aquimarina muelleri]MCX2761430.1 cytochrome P450 [Aquimarina muelleri]GGX13636.1 cytochrome P450 [Aquimarina muelleri]